MTPNRRLKQARELRGWSQAKVAELIGTDATTVSRWERGIFSPTPYFRERLCNLFSRNAEELGLLEAVDPLPERKRNDFSPPTPMSMPSFQANEERQQEALYARNPVTLMAPSWSTRTDTLSYILHSAAHDQQAHMLWGDAYVQDLHGQHAEAQQLGEASLSAFERVGHLNATAIREWLNQRELASSKSPTTNISPAPLPIHPEQHKRSSGKIIRRRGTGIALLLMAIVVLLLAGNPLGQLGQPALASSSTTHTPFAVKTPTQDNSLSKLVSNPTPTLAPSPTSTPVQPAPSPTSIPVQSAQPGLSPTATATSTSAPSATLLANVTPTSLASQDCFQESLGYRCDLKLGLFTNGSQGVFNWQISGTIMLTHSPLSGTGTCGQTTQITIYILPGQKGQIIFIFTFASHTYPVSVNWQG